MWVLYIWPAGYMCAYEDIMLLQSYQDFLQFRCMGGRLHVVMAVTAVHRMNNNAEVAKTMLLAVHEA
jgi:hypothetical protein